ncbi:hypothetical protein V6N12_023690 [Hibiscus sabdariffa]|uniref:Uncharacterized protein n=1 Tax=Hibiscus sabdariffa TaxID=183260 RepID=A0ABR2FZB0_9ROSI
MKSFKMYATIFMLVLLFAAGKEVAATEKLCHSTHSLEGCKNDICTRECIIIHGNGAEGACVGPPGMTWHTCECTYHC